MWTCCRPARVDLPTWAGRLPQLSRPSSTFSNFTTSRTTARVQPIILKRSRRLKVYSFKGNSQTGEGPREGHMSSKKPASLSCFQQENEDIVDSATSIRNKVSVSPEGEEETITGSQVVENLFKRWLILLRSQKPSSVEVLEEQIHKEDSGQQQFSETNYWKPGQLVGNLLKAVFLRIWALDVTLKIPLLIIPPAYLAVRLVYGVEVAQELTPLWVYGPVILALYVNIIRRVCLLYAFCFRLTKNLIFSLPAFYVGTVSFIKGMLLAYIWHPINALLRAEYKEYRRQKLKEFTEWADVKRLEYIDAFWPYYFRLIRFLKTSKFI